MRPLAVVWFLGLVAFPVPAPGELTCRPNIFGGERPRRFQASRSFPIIEEPPTIAS
jgi:hypothetical protein